MRHYFFTSANSSSSSSGFSTLELYSKKSVSLLFPGRYDLLSEFIRKWQIGKLFTMYVPNISFIDTKLNTTKLIWNRCNTRPWEDLLFYIFGYYCIFHLFPVVIWFCNTEIYCICYIQLIWQNALRTIQMYRIW